MKSQLVHVADAGGEGGMMDVGNSQVKLPCINQHALLWNKHDMTRAIPMARLGHTSSDLPCISRDPP